MLDSLARFSISLGAGLARFVEREAGHNLLSLAIIVTAVVIMDPGARAQAAHDLLVFGLGVLARSMGSQAPAR